MKHLGFMQRTPAEKADWGLTLIIGNIHEMRTSDLKTAKIIVDDEIKRRDSALSTAQGIIREMTDGPGATKPPSSA